MNKQMKCVVLNLADMISALKSNGTIPQSATLQRAGFLGFTEGDESNTTASKIMLRFTDSSFAEVPENHAAPEIQVTGVASAMSIAECLAAVKQFVQNECVILGDVNKMTLEAISEILSKDGVKPPSLNQLLKHTGRKCC